MNRYTLITHKGLSLPWGLINKSLSTVEAYDYVKKLGLPNEVFILGLVLKGVRVPKGVKVTKVRDTGQSAEYNPGDFIAGITGMTWPEFERHALSPEGSKRGWTIIELGETGDGDKRGDKTPTSDSESKTREQLDPQTAFTMAAVRQAAQDVHLAVEDALSTGDIDLATKIVNEYSNYTIELLNSYRLQTTAKPSVTEEVVAEVNEHTQLTIENIKNLIDTRAMRDALHMYGDYIDLVKVDAINNILNSVYKEPTASIVLNSYLVVEEDNKGARIRRVLPGSENVPKKPKGGQEGKPPDRTPDIVDLRILDAASYLLKYLDHAKNPGNKKGSKPPVYSALPLLVADTKSSKASDFGAIFPSLSTLKVHQQKKFLHEVIGILKLKDDATATPLVKAISIVKLASESRKQGAIEQKVEATQSETQPLTSEQFTDIAKRIYDHYILQCKTKSNNIRVQNKLERGITVCEAVNQIIGNEAETKSLLDKYFRIVGAEQIERAIEDVGFDLGVTTRLVVRPDLGEKATVYNFIQEVVAHVKEPPQSDEEKASQSDKVRAAQLAKERAAQLAIKKQRVSFFLTAYLKNLSTPSLKLMSNFTSLVNRYIGANPQLNLEEGVFQSSDGSKKLPLAAALAVANLPISNTGEVQWDFGQLNYLLKGSTLGGVPQSEEDVNDDHRLLAVARYCDINGYSSYDHILRNKVVTGLAGGIALHAPNEESVVTSPTIESKVIDKSTVDSLVGDVRSFLFSGGVPHHKELADCYNEFKKDTKNLHSLNRLRAAEKKMHQYMGAVLPIVLTNLSNDERQTVLDFFTKSLTSPPDVGTNAHFGSIYESLGMAAPLVSLLKNMRIVPGSFTVVGSGDTTGAKGFTWEDTAGGVHFFVKSWGKVNHTNGAVDFFHATSTKDNNTLTVTPYESKLAAGHETAHLNSPDKFIRSLHELVATVGTNKDKVKRNIVKKIALQSTINISCPYGGVDTALVSTDNMLALELDPSKHAVSHGSGVMNTPSTTEPPTTTESKKASARPAQGKGATR